MFVRKTKNVLIKTVWPFDSLYGLNYLKLVKIDLLAPPRQPV